MPLALACASHTPLMRDGYCPDDIRVAVSDGFRSLSDAIRDFSPDLVIQFSPDHFNGFFYDVMPSFCIGMAAESVGDWHTRSGPLDVPEAEAARLASALVEGGFDIATSYRMKVDHGFVQLWENLGATAFDLPTIPIFVNCAAPPLPTFRRARELGEAVGRFAVSLDRKVLLVASGGLSHDPPTPRITTAPPEVRERLIANRNPTPEARAAHQQRVLAAGRDALAGTGGILPVSEAWDADFLRCLREEPPAVFDTWSVRDLPAVAGRGAPEVLCWVAAVAALSAAGAIRTELHFYRAIQGWLAGMAMLSGRAG